MSVFDDDVITRARTVRDRLEVLRAHQTEQRRRLHAMVIQDLLDSGLTLSQAGGVLKLSRTFVHRESQRETEVPDEQTEFSEIDDAIERYVLG